MCYTFLAPPSIFFCLFLCLFFFCFIRELVPKHSTAKIKSSFWKLSFRFRKKPMYWMLSKAHRSPKQECRSKTVEQLQLLSHLAWDQAPYWRGGGGGEKRGETAKNRRACSFPSPDSLSTRFHSPIFFAFFAQCEALFKALSDLNRGTVRTSNVSITCNWGPLLL